MNNIIKNIKASIAFLRKHSKASADLAEAQLEMLILTKATAQDMQDFSKDLDAANDVWR